MVKKIIKNPRLSDTKVVFLTFLITKQEAGDYGKKVEDLFLAKPVKSEVLVDTIPE
ncbi:MAG: hypothetical protein ACJA2Q_002056 [Pseudohongiellaceae bacterium]